MCVCGQRALGLPRLGGVGLCCPPSPRPALWVSVAAHGAEGAGQPLLLCPAPGPREEGEEGGQKGQEDMEERCHRERRERVSLRVWSSWGDEDRGELAPELEVGFWAWGGEGKRHPRRRQGPRPLASCRRSSRSWMKPRNVWVSMKTSRNRRRLLEETALRKASRCSCRVLSSRSPTVRNSE